MSTNLYLVRHGIAVNLGENGVRFDADRMLSEEGLEKTRIVACGLKQLVGGEVQRIVSSPYCRARQTADIISDVFGKAMEVELADELAAGEDVHGQLRWLRKQKAVPTIAVGHMPDLALIASFLISGGDRASVEFKKAAVAGIVFPREFAVGAGCLQWLLPPLVLRRLARKAE